MALRDDAIFEKIVIAIVVDIAFVGFSASCFRPDRRNLTDSEYGRAANSISKSSLVQLPCSSAMADLRSGQSQLT